MKIFASVLSVVFLAAGSASLRADTLHADCVSPTPTCTDNGTVTPTGTNPPSFGFLGSPGASASEFELILLDPNNLDPSPGSFSMTIDGTNTGNSQASSALFSMTAWTTGTLADYFGLGKSGPNNPLGAWLPSTQNYDPSATGYYVYTFNFGATATGKSTSTTNPEFQILSGPLPQGSVFLGMEFDSSGNMIGSTANSGALLEDGGTPTPEPAAAGLMLGGAGVLFVLGRRAVR